MYLFLHDSSDVLLPLQHRWLYFFSITLKIHPFKILYKPWEYMHPEKANISAISHPSPAPPEKVNF